MICKEDFNMELKNLSPQFYADYNQKEYPELMLKDKRPYSCFVINCKDYTICIPYRSNISRNNAFLFQNTERSKRSRSGLDYEKMVIIKESDKYLDNSQPIVDSDEYVETVTESKKIVSDALEYIDKYKKHITGEEPLHPRKYFREYGYTTLQYFHKELELDFEKNAELPDKVDEPKSDSNSFKEKETELEDKQFFDTANMIDDMMNPETDKEKVNKATNQLKYSSKEIDEKITISVSINER